ncbi:Ig-like domain-containing protein, partial [Amylibacter sp.]|nr:Ig-like domain-containing protein [Amylibacter sp.]
MNKQIKDKAKAIDSSSKVSVEEVSIIAPKIYELSGSAETSTAYVVMSKSFDDIPLELSCAKYDNTDLLSARVVADENQLEAFVAAGNFAIETIEIPAGEDREIFLKKWAKAAKKRKVNLLPLLLLPLAACSGSGDVDVDHPFSVLESSSAPGTWDVTPGDGGAINIIKGAGATEYSFDPTTGDTIEVAIAGVGEIVLSSGTYSAEVSALDTPSGIEAISGAGDLALTKLEAVPDADLSVITTTGTKTVAVSDGEDVIFAGNLGSGFITSVGTGSTLSVIAPTIDGQEISGAGVVTVRGDLSDDLGVDLSGVTATGGVIATETAGGTFGENADLGVAVFTINSGTVDLQAAGVDGVDEATFIVNAGTLVVTHAQVDAISNTTSITGSSGMVTVIAGSDTATGVSALLDDGNMQTSTALVKVNMSGAGTLTFDLPSDDNDTLVLEAGSIINLGSGGTLVVADGQLDARNLNVDSGDWSGVANVIVNSGLKLTVKQLAAATSVDTDGAGRLDIVIEEETDLDLLQTIISDGALNKLTGTAKPSLTMEASSTGTSADIAVLEAVIISKAPAISAAAKIAVPVNKLDGGVIYTSPNLDIDSTYDTGVSSADNVSNIKIPLMKIILPNEHIIMAAGDTISLRVETYDGTTFTEITTSSIDILLTADNMSTDANGNSYINYDALDLHTINGDGAYYITALATSSEVTALPSNKIMYVLDTAAPTAAIDISTTGLGAAHTTKVTVAFSEKVVGFDPDADIALSDSSAGSLSAFTSADGGKTWVSEFTPTAGVASGSTTINLADESYTDVAGNSGAGTVSSEITVDTKVPDAPTVAAVSVDNLINKTENDAGFDLTGTGEANATVTVSGFVTGPKTALVVGDAWTLGVAYGDLAADAATVLSVTQVDAVGN